MDYIYLRVGMVRPGGGGGGGTSFRVNLIFLPGGLWGGKNKFERKRMGGQDNFFFLPNLSANYFFFKWEGKA